MSPENIISPELSPQEAQELLAGHEALCEMLLQNNVTSASELPDDDDFRRMTSIHLATCEESHQHVSGLLSD